MLYNIYYYFDPFEQFELIWFSGLFKCPKFYPTQCYGSVGRLLFLFDLILIFIFINCGGTIKKTKLNYFFIVIYEFIEHIIKFSIEYKRYFFFPLFLLIFIYIMFNNLFGLIPYVYTSTSHFIVTLYISSSIFFGNTLIGLYLHELKFFSLFLPEGVPIFIMPLLVLIEYVSYCSRLFSLAIRLFANMMAGHVLLKILIGFIFGFCLGLKVLPWTVIFCIIFLEFVIAFLQSYVFLVLITSYLNDAVSLH